MSNSDLYIMSEQNDTRKSIWDLIQKKPDTAACPDITPELPLAVEAQEEKPVQNLPPEPIPDARELPETKVVKQLSEMTKLLEQQTTLLYAQQKLLEDLVGRQTVQKKRKPGMVKKLKTIIHKGKMIWNVL